MKRDFQTLAAAVVAAIAWCAVLLQLGLSLQLATQNGKSVLGGLVVFSGYFTVLTNIFVAIVCTAGVLGRNATEAPPFYRPSIAGCATTAIVIVGIGYHLLLRNVWAPQ